MESQAEVKMKVLFVGQSNSGKTTLIHWESQRKIPSIPTTIGIDFKKKTYRIGDVSAQVLLWDTAGGERLMSIKSLYRYTHAICVCFSLNERYTFERLEAWRKILKTNQVDCPVFLVGCKADLEHVITEEEIKEYAVKEGMTYFQTSAIADIGVTENIQKVVEAAFVYYQKYPQVRMKPLNSPTQGPGFCWS